MATIGTLVVNLIARTSVFERKMQTSRGSLRALQLQAARSRKQFLAFTKAAIGVAVVGYAIVKVSKKYAEFEKQMAMVSTMLDKQSMKLMPEYAKQMKNMAIEFGEGTETLSKGLYDILSASIAPVKAMEVLGVSVKAAKAGMTDTGVAADAITTILNSYGLSADRAGDVSDKLFAIVKRGKLTFAELAPNIGKVASLANTAGLSFDELGAAIATMTRAGLQADLATTSLRSIITQFLKPTDEAIKAAAHFGLELSSTTLRAMGLTGALLKLREATAEQLVVILPNVRGLAGFAAMLKQVEKQAEDLELILHPMGLTQEALEKMTNTLSHSYNRLSQVVKVAAIEFGSTLAPGMSDTADAITELINKNRELIIGFGETAAIGDKVYTTLKWILIISSYLVSGIITVKAAVTETAAIFSGLAAAAVRSFAVIAKGLEKLQNIYAESWLGKKLGVEKATRHLELEALADDLDAVARALQKKAGQMMLDLPSVGLLEVIEKFEALRKKSQATAEAIRDMGETAIDAQAVVGEGIEILSESARKARQKVEQITSALDKELEITGRLNESRERSRDLIELQMAAEEGYGKGAERTIDILEEYGKKLRQLEQAQKLAEVADVIGESFASAFERMIFDAEKFGDVMVSVLRDIAREMMRILVTRPLAQALATFGPSFMAGLFGGTASAGVGGGTGRQILGTSSAMASYAHGGGVVGQILARREVSALAFAGAPRLHGGFGSDEFPAILQRGETVIPRGGAAPGIVVNINNQTASPMEAGRKNVRFDGEKYIVDVVVKDYQTGGQIRNLIKGQE